MKPTALTHEILNTYRLGIASTRQQPTQKAVAEILQISPITIRRHLATAQAAGLIRLADKAVRQIVFLPNYFENATPPSGERRQRIVGAIALWPGMANDRIPDLRFVVLTTLPNGAQSWTCPLSGGHGTKTHLLKDRSDCLYCRLHNIEFRLTAEVFEPDDFDWELEGNL